MPSPSSFNLISLLLVASSYLLRLCSAGCYTPNGTERNGMYGQPVGWYYAPCSSLVEVSMCCAIGPGRGNVSQGADSCRPDGTCFNQDDNLYWRESCTDPTWQDPACIKLFMNGSAGPDATVDIQMYLCDDGSYCNTNNATDYGADGHACCAAKQGVFVGVNGTQTSINPNSTSTTTSSTASSTSSSTPSATSSTPPATSTASSSGGGLSTGAKAGIGVGIGVAAIAVLVGVGIFTYIRHSRRSRATRDNIASSREPKYSAVDQGPPGELPSSSAYQGYSPGRVELEQGPRKAPGAGHGPQELPGS